MTSVSQKHSDVVLFYAGESLLEQAAGWARRRPNALLRLVSSCSGPVISEALSNASSAIIDVTERPDEAIDVFLYAVERIERSKLAVYTERGHDGLEIFVRLRGVFLLLGPLSLAEWEAFFDPTEPENARSERCTSFGKGRKRSGKYTPVMLLCRN
jgi:hypothetical protein